jgi:hypothetical protein
LEDIHCLIEGEGILLEVQDINPGWEGSFKVPGHEFPNKEEGNKFG